MNSILNKVKKYFFEITVKDSETSTSVASTTTSSEYSHQELTYNPQHAIKGINDAVDVLMYAFSENLWKDQTKPVKTPLEVMEEHAFYEAGLSADGCLQNLDDYTKKAIENYGRILLKSWNHGN